MFNVVKCFTFDICFLFDLSYIILNIFYHIDSKSSIKYDM